MKFLKFSLVLLTVTSASFAGRFDETQKRFIYEIISPASAKFGTGFVIKDSLLHYFLVTCKHVVQDSTANYVDSILVRSNILSASGQSMSDTSCFVLHLKVNKHLYLAEHPDADVDLVMIPFLDANTTWPEGKHLFGQRSEVVPSKERIKELGIDEGTDVELIGFSLSSSLSRSSVHYPFSRFGKVGLFTAGEFTLIIDGVARTADYVLLDMTIRPGDSGSPIFAYVGAYPYLVGFLSARSQAMEYGIGYPAYYLYDLIEIMRDRYRGLLGKQREPE